MQDHQKETKTGDIRKYNHHTRNENGIKEREESPKNADSRKDRLITAG